MRCIISLQAETNEKFYIKSLYPVNWSGYISGALWFEDIKSARTALTSRHTNLVASLKGNYERIKNIQFDVYDNGTLIQSEKYLQ